LPDWTARPADPPFHRQQNRGSGLPLFGIPYSKLQKIKANDMPRMKYRNSIK